MNLTTALIRRKILSCVDLDALCLGWQIDRTAVRRTLGVRLDKLPALPVPPNSTTIVRAHRLTAFPRQRIVAESIGLLRVNPKAKEARKGVVAEGRAITFWLSRSGAQKTGNAQTGGVAEPGTGVNLVDRWGQRRGLLPNPVTWGKPRMQRIAQYRCGSCDRSTDRAESAHAGTRFHNLAWRMLSASLPHFPLKQLFL